MKDEKKGGIKFKHTIMKRLKAKTKLKILKAANSKRK